VVAAPVDPEAAALTVDDARRLSAALGSLKLDDRQILAYRYFAGLSEIETATAAGVPLGTVKSRTARGPRQTARRVGAAMIDLERSLEELAGRIEIPVSSGWPMMCCDTSTHRRYARAAVGAAARRVGSPRRSSCSSCCPARGEPLLAGWASTACASNPE
jgi:hypothetical protein